MAKKILQLRQMGSADTHKLAYECQISENRFKETRFHLFFMEEKYLLTQQGNEEKGNLIEFLCFVLDIFFFMLCFHGSMDLNS